MSVPTVTFSPWSTWGAIETSLLASPGVYFVAAQRNDLVGKVPQAQDNLLYVGETCEQALATRLNQFRRSAFRNLRAHSGGTSFYEIFGQTMTEEQVLYSILPVALAEPFGSAYIRFIERSVIWRHVEHFGERPACNSK